jgi:hypothetical protein
MTIAGAGTGHLAALLAHRKPDDRIDKGFLDRIITDKSRTARIVPSLAAALKAWRRELEGRAGCAGVRKGANGTS